MTMRCFDPYWILPSRLDPLRGLGSGLRTIYVAIGYGDDKVWFKRTLDSKRACSMPYKKWEKLAHYAVHNGDTIDQIMKVLHTYHEAPVPNKETKK